jgi:hypothetical protein
MKFYYIFYPPRCPFNALTTSDLRIRRRRLFLSPPPSDESTLSDKKRRCCQLQRQHIRTKLHRNLRRKSRRLRTRLNLVKSP